MEMQSILTIKILQNITWKFNLINIVDKKGHKQAIIWTQNWIDQTSFY